MQNILSRARVWYGRGASGLSYLQSPFLLAIRLYWGYQFMQDGLGKLAHLGKVSEYFSSLALPMPTATAFAVGTVELAGGLLFTLGIASRLVSLALFLNMTMAFLAVPDDRTNFSHIFSAPDDFYRASPFGYWFAALLILILGPGAFAIDWILARNWKVSEADPAPNPKQTAVR